MDIDYLAQHITTKPIGPTIGGGGLEPGPDVLGNIITGVVTLIFVVGGLVAFYYIIMGGFDLITSSGEPDKMQKGRNKIIWAVTGLVILLSSYGIMVFLQDVLDVCFGFGGCSVSLNFFN